MASHPAPVGRPSLGGAGRHENQYRLAAETVNKKLAVIAFHDRFGMRATITEFYKTMSGEFDESKRTTILRWRRERKKLEIAAAEGKGAHTKIRSRGMGTILPYELEKDIVQWVNELREEGIPVSSRMLTEKARQLALEATVVGFRGSDKWVNGFKHRHQFSLRVPTRQSQISPSDINAIAAAFAREVEITMRDLGITRVFNADQTGTLFSFYIRDQYLIFNCKHC
jgi:hypothetical protein